MLNLKLLPNQTVKCHSPWQMIKQNNWTKWWISCKKKRKKKRKLTYYWFLNRVTFSLKMTKIRSKTLLRTHRLTARCMRLTRAQIQRAKKLEREWRHIRPPTKTWKISMYSRRSATIKTKLTCSSSSRSTWLIIWIGVTGSKERPLKTTWRKF